MEETVLQIDAIRDKPAAKAMPQIGASESGSFACFSSLSVPTPSVLSERDGSENQVASHRVNFKSIFVD